MLTSAIILIFISAILHVGWNVLLQGTDDPLDVSTKAVGIGIALLTPFIVIYWVLSHTPIISSQAIFWGFLSGVAQLGYFFFLSYSYRHGELSVVYPIARGSAPVLTFILGIFLLHENVTAHQVIGVALLIFGIWLVRQAKLQGTKGILPALLTGAFIAIYTVIDKIGLNYTSPIYFGGLKYLFTALCLVAFIPFKNYFKMYKGEKGKKTSWKKIAIIGVCIIATYQLVLFALSMAPVALVSPLRESAAVVVTAWGIWKLKEREGLRYKIIGVVLIFLGIVSLSLY